MSSPQQKKKRPRDYQFMFGSTLFATRNRQQPFFGVIIFHQKHKMVRGVK